MIPMSMTYHHHVMANLRREADGERRVRSVGIPEDPPHRTIRSLFAVRAAAPQA